MIVQKKKKILGEGKWKYIILHLVFYPIKIFIYVYSGNSGTQNRNAGTGSNQSSSRW